MYDSSHLFILEIDCAAYVFVLFASVVRGVDQHHRVNYNEIWFMKDERLGCVLSCEVVFFEPKLPAV